VIRFEWLDQFRGLVILLFTVQTLAYALFDKTGIHVIAPHLNHGYKYATIEGGPNIITLIDLGQDIFLFLVGFMAAFSMLKIIARDTGSKDVWIRIIRRFVAIMILNAIHMAVAGRLDAKHLLFGGTLATIAWVGLIAMIVTLYIKEPDKRIIIAAAIFGIQILIDLLFKVDNIYISYFGDIGVGIMATAFSGWMFTKEGTVIEENIGKKILPTTFICFSISYLVGFIQWADHHRTTVALATMTIGVCGIALFMFYNMDKYDYKIKFLIPWGKNLLLMFLLEMIIIELFYMDMFLYDFVLINPWLDLILVGIIPFIILWVIAKILEKKNIYFRV
jgi:predicted acyltransferase